MMRTRVWQTPSWRRSLGRIAAAALALGGLSALAGVPGVAAAATSPKTATEIATAKNAKLGTVLVSGNTVYILKPSKTACDVKCLKAWPPVLLPDGVTSPTAGTGVDASKLGTMATADGAMQITYAGKPLFWFAKDKAPGQVHGNVTDKWGKWATVVTVKSRSTTKAPDTTSSNGGNGF